jgi:uncharacterized membrane protein
VNVPVRTVYNQWTQFEQFPRFMDGVERVEQLDERTLHWTASLGGKHTEWDAVISEQIPDKRVAWTSTDGAKNAGVVTFHYLEETKTRVTLQMDYDPEGIVENVGDKLGFVGRKVTGDLARFKSFIEEQGFETGAWRGSIAHQSDQQPE